MGPTVSTPKVPKIIMFFLVPIRSANMPKIGCIAMKMINAKIMIVVTVAADRPAETTKSFCI
ncbi:hypothetical protein D3C85_1405230 [compost metagenome]